jgi:hypothetical protein
MVFLKINIGWQEWFLALLPKKINNEESKKMLISLYDMIIEIFVDLFIYSLKMEKIGWQIIEESMCIFHIYEQKKLLKTRPIIGKVFYGVVKYFLNGVHENSIPKDLFKNNNLEKNLLSNFVHYFTIIEEYLFYFSSLENYLSKRTSFSFNSLKQNKPNESMNRSMTQLKSEEIFTYDVESEIKQRRDKEGNWIDLG